MSKGCTMKDKTTHTSVTDGKRSVFTVDNLDADIKHVEDQIAALSEQKSGLGYKLRSLRSLRKNAQELSDAGFLQTSLISDEDDGDESTPSEDDAA